MFGDMGNSIGGSFEVPWKDRSTSSLREELVSLMGEEGSNVSALCRRFGVSRKTAYKWLSLSASGCFEDGSRRPLKSPRLSSSSVEELVLAVREEHPAWGGRKIRASLLAQGELYVPSASTVTAILRRHGRLDGPRAGKPRDFQRFEREKPNELWQMDFKGHFATRSGVRCHPLTLLDDHSRFLLGVWSCENERGATVKAHLEEAFSHYGLPGAILCDNGGPWSSRGGPCPTELEAWLMRLGVRPIHGTPYHPQTQGKLEKFHFTLLNEVIRRQEISGILQAQERFDVWREIYNRKRPHEALDDAVPASRYQESQTPFPKQIPSPNYLPQDRVKTVRSEGWVYMDGKQFRLGDGLVGQPVAFRPTPIKDVYEIHFCNKFIGQLDSREKNPIVRYRDKTVTHVSEQV